MSFFLLLLRGVVGVVPVDTDAKIGRINFDDYVGELSPLVPLESDDRTIVMIPAFTPVVALVT